MEEWGGLARFDGETATRYLDGQRISAVEFADGGSAWVITKEALVRDGEEVGATGLYVVNPEVAADTE